MQARELPAPWDRVADEGGDVKRFEVELMAWIHQTAQRAWQAFADAVEKRIEAENGNTLRRKGRESRTLWTVLGPVKIRRQRYYYTDDREDGSFIGFDTRAGLPPRLQVTSLLTERVAALASIATSYKAAETSMRILLGDSPCAKTIWNHVQKTGKELRERDAEERRAVFDGGELPGAEKPPKDFVGVETDSTMIHAWRRKGENHEAFLGIAYDGKEESGRRKKRRRLTNKVAACGVYGAREFGRDLFVAAQKHHNVFDAKVMLYGSDGAACLETIRQEHFPQAPHQLDWKHVVDKTREAYGWDRIDDARKTMDLIFSEDRDGFERQTIFDRQRLPGRRSKIDELRGYVLPRWEWLFSYRRLREKNNNVPPHLNGTGAEERNIATVVGHRMKHRGMGWTQRGAANILRVRLRTLGLQG